MTDTLIGYGRVSTDDQNASLQEDALAQAGCIEVFTDHDSASKSNRPYLTGDSTFRQAPPRWYPITSNREGMVVAAGCGAVARL